MRKVNFIFSVLCFRLVAKLECTDNLDNIDCYKQSRGIVQRTRTFRRETILQVRHLFSFLYYRSGLLALLQEGGIAGVEKQYEGLIDEQKATYQKW